MRAGALEQRIVLEAKGQGAADKFGQPAIVWRILDTVAAEITYGIGADASRAGDETDTGGKVVALANVYFTIRYRDDIIVNGSTRIRHDGQIFNIKTVSKVGRREKMIIGTQLENN